MRAVARRHVLPARLRVDFDLPAARVRPAAFVALPRRAAAAEVRRPPRRFVELDPMFML